MLFRLQALAAGTYDDLFEGLDQYKRYNPPPSFGRPQPISDYSFFCMITYLPVTAHSPIYATHVLGYALCFKVAGIILGRGEIPTVQKMMREIRTSCNGEIEYFDGRAIESFLNKGGCVEYVLNAIIHRSWEEGPDGDASFDDVFEDDPGFQALPACINDDAHEVIRLHVGLGPDIDGPYNYPLPGLNFF